MALACAASLARAQTNGSADNSTAKAADPRVGLGAGWNDAQEAARNLTHVGHGAKPEGWFNPAKISAIPCCC